MQLTHEEERRARERADMSESGFWIFVVGLVLVAAFCTFMIVTATGG